MGKLIQHNIEIFLLLLGIVTLTLYIGNRFRIKGMILETDISRTRYTLHTLPLVGLIITESSIALHQPYIYEKIVSNSVFFVGYILLWAGVWILAGNALLQYQWRIGTPTTINWIKFIVALFDAEFKIIPYCDGAFIFALFIWNWCIIHKDALKEYWGKWGIVLQKVKAFLLSNPLFPWNKKG